MLSLVVGCYLRCHVERGEPILGLDIDAGAVSHEDLDHLALDQSEVSIVVSSPPIRGEYCGHVTSSPPITAHLAGEGGDVQRGVPLLGGRVNPGALRGPIRGQYLDLWTNERAVLLLTLASRSCTISTWPSLLARCSAFSPF